MNEDLCDADSPCGASHVFATAHPTHFVLLFDYSIRKREHRISFRFRLTEHCTQHSFVTDRIAYGSSYANGSAGGPLSKLVLRGRQKDSDEIYATNPANRVAVLSTIEYCISRYEKEYQKTSCGNIPDMEDSYEGNIRNVDTSLATIRSLETFRPLHPIVIGPSCGQASVPHLSVGRPLVRVFGSRQTIATR